MVTLPTNIKFTKMQGLGNDFVVINAITETLSLDPLFIKKISDRYIGIGFDQLLLIDQSANADFSCRFFNADGSEAEQCGNGVRCVARFLHENHLLKKNTLSLETKGGMLEIFIPDYENIQVTMGTPHFYKSSLENFITLSIGNPHAILRVESLLDFPVKTEGKKISEHAVFPQGINVGYVEVLDREHIRLRTYERGVGETFACGSNAVAAVAAGIKNHWLDKKVLVELKYGNLIIEWSGENNPILMTGPAEKVYEGKL